MKKAIEQAEKQEPVLKPCWYESKEKTMCRKCGQVHAEAIPPAAQPAPTQEHQINQLEKFKNHVLANANALGVVLDAPAAPVQEPVAWLSRRYVDNFPSSGYETAQPTDYGAFPVYTTPQPQQAQKQEPWVWQQSPIKTQWGDDMVVADLAIDKDHTVSVYCERDQTARVEAMFNRGC